MPTRQARPLQFWSPCKWARSKEVCLHLLDIADLPPAFIVTALAEWIASSIETRVPVDFAMGNMVHGSPQVRAIPPQGSVYADLGGEA